MIGTFIPYWYSVSAGPVTTHVGFWSCIVTGVSGFYCSVLSQNDLMKCANNGLSLCQKQLVAEVFCIFACLFSLLSAILLCLAAFKITMGRAQFQVRWGTYLSVASFIFGLIGFSVGTNWASSATVDASAYVVAAGWVFSLIGALSSAHFNKLTSAHTPLL